MGVGSQKRGRQKHPLTFCRERKREYDGLNARLTLVTGQKNLIRKPESNPHNDQNVKSKTHA